MKKMRSIVLLLFVLLLVPACATKSLYSAKVPGATLDNLKTFYVVWQDKDNRDLHKLIMAELNRLGYKANAGFRKDIPDDVDAVITYKAQWMWDITLYLLKLNIQIKNPETNFPLVKGESFRTSLVRESPEVMIKEVLETIFKNN